MDLKVTNGNIQNQKAAAPKKLSPDEIAQKIAGKFGKTAEIKKPAPKITPDTTTEINSQETIAHSDIDKNDPSSELTREKLRGLLTGGGVMFNDKERKALAEILK